MHRTSHKWLPWTLALLGGSVCLLLLGCGTGNFENVNDQLRSRNLKLERQVAQLRDQLQLRSGKIDTLRQRLDRQAPGQTPGTRPRSPMLSKIRIGGYSGLIDADGDGRDDTAKIYLKTLDGQGRMLPVSARVTVQLVAIRHERPPRQLASKTYPPQAFEQAYRSGFTGTHYTLEAKLPSPLPQGVDQATVRVTVVDQAHGTRFTAQKAYPLDQKQP